MIFRFFTLEGVNFSYLAKNFISIFLILSLSLSVSAIPIDDVQHINLQDKKKLLKKAKKLHRKGKNREAEKILRQLMARFPQSAEAKLDLASILLKEKRLINAFNLAIEVAKEEKDNSYAFALLGATYLSAGNFKEARVFLNNSLRLSKKEALARAGLGMLNFYENKPVDSLKNLRLAVRYDSKEADYLFALGQVAARTEQYREAAEAYEGFLRVATTKDNERIQKIKGLVRFLRYLDKKLSIYTVAGEKETIIPLNIVNNRPVIEVKLKKDGEPLKFVLDTGSGMTVLSEKTAKKLNIKKITEGGEARALGGDGRFDIAYGFLNKIRLGDVQIKNVPIYIRKFHNQNNEFDGYIGLSVISKFITTIDYGAKSFILTKNENYYNNQEETLKNSKTVPLRLTSSGFLSGLVKLEGFETSLSFIVDTGASVSVISQELANSQEMKGFLQNRTINVTGAAGITENAPMFLLPEVSFGGSSRENLTAVALNLALINETSGFEQAGILGGNFLMNYRLTFDFEKSRVTFVPIQNK